MHDKPQLGRRKLGLPTRIMLVVLRIYVIVAVPLVIYAFVRALRS